MKPDWDKLIKSFADSKTTLIADVDCTAAGKPLCDANGVRGFPTIKHGAADNLEDYRGGRDFASLKKFADGLKPLCGPKNKDLCDEEQLAVIEKYETMELSELKALISEGEDAIAAAEKNFKDEVQKLQSKYESLMADKDKTIEDVKKAGLGTQKSVYASRK